MTLTIENLSLYHDAQPVLTDFSCICKPGTATALFGNNGTGKTTLLATIAGIHKKYTGTIHNTHESKSYATDTPILFDHDSAREHFTYLHALHNLPVDTQYRDQLGLEKYKNHKTSELSQGNKQKLNIACSLIANPDLILRDEPSNGLDHKTRVILADIITTLKKQQKTLILTTHTHEDIQYTRDQKIHL